MSNLQRFLLTIAAIILTVFILRPSHQTQENNTYKDDQSETNDLQIATSPSTSLAPTESLTKSSSTSNKIESTEKAVALAASSSPPPIPRYIETFAGLPTKEWFHEGRDVETVNRVDHAFTERDTKLDFRLLKLAELTTTDMISLNETPAQSNLAKIYDGSSAPKASFLRGELISSELSDFPIDIPICTFNFNRSKSIWILRGRRLLMIEKAETFELQDGIRGVRVSPKSEPGKKAYWISSIECIVKESDKSRDLYKKILFIDFVATTGIPGKVYRNAPKN